MINPSAQNPLSMFDYVNIGDYERAIETAKSLPTINAREGGIMMIAFSMARNGKFVGARELANQLSNPAQVENVLAKIDANESQHFQKTARKVGRVASVNSNLKLIAQGLHTEVPEKDKFKEAYIQIFAFRNDTIRGLKFQSLARGMYKIGDLGKATMAALQIPDPLLKKITLQEIYFKRGPVEKGNLYKIVP